MSKKTAQTSGRSARETTQVAPSNQPAPKFASAPPTLRETRRMGKTLFAKIAIAIASVSITLGGWGLFAVIEPKATAQAASIAAPSKPTQAPTASVMAGPVAPKKAAAQNASPKPAKGLRVVTAPTPVSPPVIIAITRSSN